MVEVLAVLPRRLPDRGDPDRADRDEELHVGGAVGGQRRDKGAFGLRPEANLGGIDVAAGAQQAQPGQRILGQHRVVAPQQRIPHGPLVIDQRHDSVPGEGLGLGAELVPAAVASALQHHQTRPAPRGCFRCQDGAVQHHTAVADE